MREISIFIIMLCFLILFILVIGVFIYYKKIKKIRKLEELTLVHNSVLCLIVCVVNKFYKKGNFIAIVNVFNSRVHILRLEDYNNINEHNSLYKHELVHLYQIKKIGSRFRFLIKTIFNCIRYGYWKNPFEVEAYLLENKSLDEIREHFNV